MLSASGRVRAHASSSAQHSPGPVVVPLSVCAPSSAHSAPVTRVLWDSAYSPAARVRCCGNPGGPHAASTASPLQTDDPPAPVTETEQGQAPARSLDPVSDTAAAGPAKPAPQPSTSTAKLDSRTQKAWELVERKPLAGGWLELVAWEDSPSQRLLRVWLPPGYYTEGADGELTRAEPPAGGWPVFYMHDGQNLFKDRLSFSGHSWRAAETAHRVISSGKVPPFVIVGMDHAGAQRSYEYTPYKPGTGPGGYRKDAANWPGGGVWQHLEQVAEEVMPWAHKAYSVSSDPSRVAMGGSSFGGIATLCAAMKYPGLFHSALVESPSLWLAEGTFLDKDIRQHTGRWPERMFVAMGDSEYQGDESLFFSKLLVMYLNELTDILTEQGAGSGLVSKVGKGATHSEKAWAGRLESAYTHLCAHWRTDEPVKH